MSYVKNVIKNYMPLFDVLKKISIDKRRNLFKAFVVSQFNYCPLVWMFHTKELNNWINSLHEKAIKVVSATFLLVCFERLKESTWKNVFYFTSKALFVLEISSFNFSDIQMSCRHQIAKHGT